MCSRCCARIPRKIPLPFRETQSFSNQNSSTLEIVPRTDSFPRKTICSDSNPIGCSHDDRKEEESLSCCGSTRSASSAKHSRLYFEERFPLPRKESCEDSISCATILGEERTETIKNPRAIHREVIIQQKRNFQRTFSYASFLLLLLPSFLRSVMEQKKHLLSKVEELEVRLAAEIRTRVRVEEANQILREEIRRLKAIPASPVPPQTPPLRRDHSLPISTEKAQPRTPPKTPPLSASSSRVINRKPSS